jgi:hypothetical protein
VRWCEACGSYHGPFLERRACVLIRKLTAQVKRQRDLTEKHRHRAVVLARKVRALETTMRRTGGSR